MNSHYEIAYILFMQSYIHQFADFLRLHLLSLSVGLVSTVLVIYGAPINNFFKRITRSIPFLGRFALFVLLCSAGYTLISSQMVQYLQMFLKGQQDLPLIGIVVGLFLIVAFLAYHGKDV